MKKLGCLFLAVTITLSSAVLTFSGCKKNKDDGSNHTHNYIGGFCECGEEHPHEFFNGVCACGKEYQSSSNGGDNSSSDGDNTPTEPEEQHSQLLNAVLNTSYYKNLIAALTTPQKLEDARTNNKYQAIPYGYLESKGYNAAKIKNNQLRCESDVFLYNNELYIALKTEVEASTNYFDCQILKYQITPEEIADLNKVFVKLTVTSDRHTYAQAPFMIQHISYLREPVELLTTPAKITPEAMALCTTKISNKNYFKTNRETLSIYLGCEQVDIYDYRFSFMIYDSYIFSTNPKNIAKIGVIEFSDAFDKCSNNIYNNTSYNISQYFPDECKTAFEESVKKVTIYSSKGAVLSDYSLELNK